MCACQFYFALSIAAIYEYAKLARQASQIAPPRPRESRAAMAALAKVAVMQGKCNTDACSTHYTFIDCSCASARPELGAP